MLQRDDASGASRREKAHTLTHSDIQKHNQPLPPNFPCFCCKICASHLRQSGIESEHLDRQYYSKSIIRNWQNQTHIREINLNAADCKRFGLGRIRGG
jgi:hypothetical protein